jgi:hypothetical protein
MKEGYLMKVFKFAAIFFFTLGLASWAGARTEASPFKPEINKLNAIVNNLVSINDRVEKVLSCPPESTIINGCPDLNGAVERLRAIDNQLFLLDALTNSVIGEVLEYSSDDNIGDVLPTLRSVRTVSLKITESVILGSLTGQVQLPAEFVRALSEVRSRAQFLALSSQEYIALIERYGEPALTCSGNLECPEGQPCIFGFCSPEDFPPPVPGTCAVDDDCPEEAYCLFSVCVPDNAPIPGFCEDDSDCPPDLTCLFNICLPF